MLQERYLTAWVWLSPKAWMTPPAGSPGGVWGVAALMALVCALLCLVNRTVMEEQLQ